MARIGTMPSNHTSRDRKNGQLFIYTSKDPMITPGMPTRGSVGQTIFRHHPHGHIDHPMSVVSARWSQICQSNVAVLFASMTVMRRVGHQEINRVTRAQITQVMQRALSRFVPRGEMRAPGTRSLLMVAMIRHELGGGEAVDVGHPLGVVWYVSSRSVHNGLPEEKGWERQYKSDRLACPDRIQNRCYSVFLYGTIWRLTTGALGLRYVSKSLTQTLVEVCLCCMSRE